jgi:hypothetical protein
MRPAARDLAERFGDGWRVAPEGQPRTARRCSCPEPIMGDDACVLCGGEAAIRLGAAVRASESASAAANGAAVGDSTPGSVRG